MSPGCRWSCTSVFFFSPKSRWNRSKMAWDWSVDGLFGQTVLLLFSFRWHKSSSMGRMFLCCIFASSLRLTNPLKKKKKKRKCLLNLFLSWKFPNFSPRDDADGNNRTRSQFCCDYTSWGISSLCLLEKQKITAVTVSNSGIGRGF